MSNFAQDIEDTVEDHDPGNQIISIRVELPWISGDEDQSGPKDLPDEVVGKNMEWSAMRPYLDYEYDDSFGSQDGCHRFCAWTSNRVFFVYEYDRSLEVVSVPRNP